MALQWLQLFVELLSPVSGDQMDQENKKLNGSLVLLEELNHGLAVML